MNKINSFLLTHLTFLKILIIAIMGFIAFFIVKDNPWNHWSWISYAGLLVFYLIAEFIQYKQSSLSPLDKVKKYLLNFDGWEETEENNWHYKEYPEFTVCPTEEDHWEVEGGENWVRAATNPRAFVRPMQIKYFQTVLVKVTCIYFDEMRGFIPAPEVTLINTNDDLYFYSISGDDFNFIVLQFLLRRTREQIFNEGLLDPRAGRIPVTIFHSNKEKNSFLSWSKSNPIKIEERHQFKGCRIDSCITDHDRNIISYSRAVLEKSEEFRA